MNTESPSALNHVQYRNEMASLDPTDPELARKIALINSKYGYGSSRKPHNTRVYHLNKTQFNTESSTESPKPHFQQNKKRYNKSNYLTNLFRGNFSEHINNVNNLLSRFQQHFENSNGPLNVDSSTEFNPSDAYNTLVNGNDSQNNYTKYVSSFTSFDSNGQKRGATVSGVEKVVNGQRTVSKKIRRYDNGVETLEQVFPDGRRVTTTRNLNQTNSKRPITYKNSASESNEDTV